MISPIFPFMVCSKQAGPQYQLPSTVNPRWRLPNNGHEVFFLQLTLAQLGTNLRHLERIVGVLCIANIFPSASNLLRAMPGQAPSSAELHATSEEPKYEAARFWIPPAA